MPTPEIRPISPCRASDMWAYLESLNWEKGMPPLARVMAHYELLERQLAAERAISNEMASQLEHASFAYDPGGCQKMFEAWKEARRA
jgi:hypothetical protein